MKKRLSWILLLWTTYLILLINNWKNFKYFPNLIKEFHRIIKKYSKYTEDGDFILIPRPKIKEF
jgi:hypothetical protein